MLSKQYVRSQLDLLFLINDVIKIKLLLEKIKHDEQMVKYAMTLTCKYKNNDVASFISDGIKGDFSLNDDGIIYTGILNSAIYNSKDILEYMLDNHNVPERWLALPIIMAGKRNNKEIKEYLEEQLT